MEVSESRELIEETCTFPIDSDSLLEQLGDVELRAPSGDTTSIAAVMDGLEADTYHSVDEVFTAIKGNVDEEFIGRKHYDDRGGARNVGADQRENESV